MINFIYEMADGFSMKSVRRFFFVMYLMAGVGFGSFSYELHRSNCLKHPSWQYFAAGILWPITAIAATNAVFTKFESTNFCK